MDPMAMAAVLGLAFVGHRMSSSNETYVEQQPIESKVANAKGDVPTFKDEDPRFRVISNNDKKEVPSFRDISMYSTKQVYGQPVYQLSSRETVSNRMNNLNPNPWQRVGPGIGVGPNTPAYGGYQQLARALPQNVNDYKLTTLASRPQAPAASLIPTQETRTTLVEKNRPNKDFFRAPGKGIAYVRAAERRSHNVRTDFPTLKEQSINRLHDDVLSGPRYITNMAHLVTDNTSLDRRDNRAKKDRIGNPGMMNVRAGPLGAGGAVTSVRIDQNHTRPNSGATLVSQGYKRDGMQRVNTFKENGNFWSDDLNLVAKQMTGNPYNHSLAVNA